DARRGEDHLGERGEIEPGLPRHRPMVRDLLRRSGDAHVAHSLDGDDAEDAARYVALADGLVHRSKGVIGERFHHHAASYRWQAASALSASFAVRRRTSTGRSQAQISITLGQRV